MKVGFVVDRPTQFEAPFFRFASDDAVHTLHVYFTGLDAPDAEADAEIGRKIDWGFDLFGGYRHKAIPRAGRIAALRRHFREDRNDLLVVNGYTRRSYVDALVAGRMAGARLALRTDSVLWPGEKAMLRRRLVLLLLRAAGYERFLVTATLGRRYMEAHGVPSGRIGRFPYAVDHEAFRAGAALARNAGADDLRSRLGVPPSARVVLSVAKHSVRETPWDLVRALARVPPETRPHAVLVGDGPDRAALESLSRTERLEGHVHFAGFLPYADLPKAYALADIFVHAAREERWGVSVAEAMACGLPVIASDRVGAAFDLVEEGRNGSVYPHGDDEALARSIPRALELSPEAVEAANLRILDGWGYAATWKDLLATAASPKRRRGE